LMAFAGDAFVVALSLVASYFPRGVIHDDGRSAHAVVLVVPGAQVTAAGRLPSRTSQINVPLIRW
jgi:hypothetical protein